ncbi:hypothetical protein AYO45_05680 [Gammaproteobacteria bacterium SCGC AG-212-F23]|nr:hypothetical protein AYO45_05680 [Gammaproteobacteria bacterium SCGC AG-212-F23]
MRSKLFGGILLIAGTSIGGGMLGLPIATAQCGLFNSCLLFIACWLYMTFTSLLILEVNLCFPRNSNMISMARLTFGKPVELIYWSLYLLFLYSLVAVYIAGGQDVMRGLLQLMHFSIPLWTCGIIFVILFGSIVMAGIRHVDIFNRVLMMIKMSAVLLLMLSVIPHIDPKNYFEGKMIYVLPAITVALTSFGFATIVPSLRAYFNDDHVKLRIAIIVGSFIPLVCYIAWNASIFGLVPMQGDFGLTRLIHLDQPITGLLDSIMHYASSNNVHLLSRVFTSICVLTAFASVSLGLSDYLADGFSISRKGRGEIFILAATFLPPLLIVMFYPKAFIFFLSLAGVFCTILLGLIPAAMSWHCRYVQKLNMPYQVTGGKDSLILTILVSILIILIATYELLLG